jgi:hypothetical protein
MIFPNQKVTTLGNSRSNTGRGPGAGVSNQWLRTRRPQQDSFLIVAKAEPPGLRPRTERQVAAARFDLEGAGD